LHLPILFVHSHKDKVVPIKSSQRLYLLLKMLGHEHVYLLELNAGLHGKLIIGPEAETYQNVVHAFYKKYNLAYNEHFALKGESFLAQCQPSIVDVVCRIKKIQK
jgi:hypothetical protein